MAILQIATQRMTDLKEVLESLVKGLTMSTTSTGHQRKAGITVSESFCITLKGMVNKMLDSKSSPIL